MDEYQTKPDLFLSGNINPIVSKAYKPPVNKNYKYGLFINLEFLTSIQL